MCSRHNIWYILYIFQRSKSHHIFRWYIAISRECFSHYGDQRYESRRAICRVYNTDIITAQTKTEQNSISTRHIVTVFPCSLTSNKNHLKAPPTYARPGSLELYLTNDVVRDPLRQRCILTLKFFLSTRFSFKKRVFVHVATAASRPSTPLSVCRVLTKGERKQCARDISDRHAETQYLPADPREIIGTR